MIHIYCRQDLEAKHRKNIPNKHQQKNTLQCAPSAQLYLCQQRVLPGVPAGKADVPAAVILAHKVLGSVSGVSVTDA